MHSGVRMHKLFLLLVIVGVSNCRLGANDFVHGGRMLQQFTSTQSYVITVNTTHVNFNFQNLSQIPAKGSFYHVAVDIDALTATGYSWLPNVGVDLMIESSAGTTCTPAPSAYRFPSTGNSTTWPAWTKLATVVGCTNTTTAVTWSLPRTALNGIVTALPNTINKCQTAQAFFNVLNGGLQSSVLPVPNVTTSCAQGIIVPAYWLPTETAKWDTVFAPPATAASPRYVIINPNNGDADNASFDAYSPVVAKARSVNVGVLGYVYTRNGARNITTVIASINKYYDRLGMAHIKGIFLDEVDVRTCDATTKSYYQQLANLIRSKEGKVVVNPGLNLLPECFWADNVMDMAMVFEDTLTAYATSYRPSVNQGRYAATRYIHAIHTTPVANLTSAIRASKWRGAGWVYVTNDVYLNPTTDNPWDTVPTNWTTQVANAGATAV